MISGLETEQAALFVQPGAHMEHISRQFLLGGNGALISTVSKVWTLM